MMGIRQHLPGVMGSGAALSMSCLGGSMVDNDHSDGQEEALGAAQCAKEGWAVGTAWKSQPQNHRAQGTSACQDSSEGGGATPQPHGFMMSWAPLLSELWKIQERQ